MTAIEVAVIRVATTGQAETLVLGTAEPKQTAEQGAAWDRHERLMAEMDRPDSDY